MEHQIKQLLGILAFCAGALILVLAVLLLIQLPADTCWEGAEHSVIAETHVTTMRHSTRLLLLALNWHSRSCCNHLGK